MSSLPPGMPADSRQAPAAATEARHGEGRVGLGEYLEMANRRKWLALSVFVGVMVLGVMSISKSKPAYVARATLMIAESNPSDVYGGARTIFMPVYPNTGNYLALLQSRAVAEAVALLLPDTMKLPATILQTMISAKTTQNTDIISLTVTAGSPGAAVVIANTYLEAFQQYDLDLSLTEVRHVSQFIDNQLVHVGARLDSSERELATFKSAHKAAGDMNDNIRVLINRQSALSAQYQQALIDEQSSRAELASVQSQIEQEGRKMADVDGISSPLVASLKGTLNQLEVEKTNLIVRGYAENSERIKGLERRIDSTRSTLRSETQVLISRQGLADPVGHLSGLFQSAMTLSTTLAALSARQQAIDAAVKELDGPLSRLPSSERIMARLIRNVETARKEYSLLAERFEEARIREVGKTSKVRTIDAAKGARRTGPNLGSRLFLALIMASAAALGSIWMAERLDTSVHGQSELERRGYIVLGSVPQLMVGGRRRRRDPAVTSHLITHTDVESSGAEAFRMLRTAVVFASAEHPVRTFAVTSPGPSDGKSTVAVNFASVLAQAGSRVLLVDADMRHPMLHTVFKHRKKPGLSDLIVLSGNPQEAIFPTGLDGLFCLPCGTIPPSPADLLTLGSARALLKRFTDEYDYVIIDTPPVLVAADTPIIGGMVDATIMVARVGRTAIEALEHARNSLLASGAHLSGLVLNDVKRTGRYGRYYYYYYKYHYSYARHAANTAAQEKEVAAAGT